MNDENEDLTVDEYNIVITLDTNSVHRSTKSKRKSTRIKDDFEKDLPDEEPPGWAKP